MVSRKFHPCMLPFTVIMMVTSDTHTKINKQRNRSFIILLLLSYIGMIGQ